MKSFLMALLMLFGFLFLGSQGASQNLLYDGNFTTTTSITPIGEYAPPLNIWCSYHNFWSVVDFMTSVSDGVCKYNFYNYGADPWDVQLIQYGFTLIPGNKYRIKFDVKADAPRSFVVYFGEESGNWTNLNTANYHQYASTEWETKSFEVDVWQTFPINKLSFEMGTENIPMYFDNIVLEQLEALPKPDIEIIGSSAPPYDWSIGVPMETSDGVNYTLNGYTLIQGELKFRQDKDWSINWGAGTFPSGIGYQNGPNIPILSGIYNIKFNRFTGAYYFECLECLPVIGMVGSAVPPYDWNTDLIMNTTDGIHYQLKSVDLQYGELRFRQDYNWNTNWGGTAFPTGTGSMYAPNIQVTAGNYDISFNRLSGEYAFILNTPLIGILGSALNGWMEDIDMQTTDGVNYTLMGQEFLDGEVKFRQDDDWAINWGGYDFPWGYAYQNGPNIPIPAGKYNVHFNRVYGNYYFDRICPDPVLVCPENIVIPTQPNLCGAVVTFTEPYPEESCGYYYIYQIEGLPNGYVYPVGITTNTFVLYHYGTGKTVSCSFTVTVVDETAPVITNVSTSATSLWPPNHKMVEVQVNYDVSENCAIVERTITVTSNEPENGLGDGDQAPDWKVMNPNLVQLRAERSGTGNGRIYTITITVKDASGNIGIATTTVDVPHSMVVKKGAVDVEGGKLAATVWPNPSYQYFNANITGLGDAPITVKVVDMSGRVISTLTATHNQTIRFGENLKPGIYIVEVLQGSEKAIQKIMKK
jgi:hypothetical protein